MKSTATANPILAGLFRSFMQDPTGFVAPFLLPAFVTGEQSATYYKFDTANLINVPQDIRHSPGAPFKRITMQVSDDLYSCRDYGIEHPVADTDRAKYRNYFAADAAAMTQLSDIIKLNRELRAKAKLAAAGIPNVTVSTKWDNYASSKPKADVNAAKAAIRKATGREPNVMVINYDVFNALQDHPLILEKYKYTSGDSITEDILARYFGVGRIVVAKGLFNSATEGQALSPSDIWGDDVWLAVTDPSENLQALNLGRTFLWSEFAAGPTGEAQVTTYRDETIESDVHRARDYCDEKITAAGAGYKLGDVLA